MKREHSTYHLIGFLLLFCLKINGQALVLEEWQNIYAVNNLEVAIDSLKQYNFEQILNTSNDLNFQKDIDSRAYFKTDQNYWGRFNLKNNLPNSSINTEWVLKFSLNFTDIEAYVVDDLGNIQKGRSGFFTPLSQRSSRAFLSARVSIHFQKP